MNAIQKTLATTIARKSGQISDAEIADQHQTIALEMFPDSKNVGVALAKFYETEIGKIALGYAAQTAYSELQKSCACGDGDIVAEKMEREEPADKDRAGEVAGVRPKVRHAHPKKRPQKATSVSGYSGEDDPDPNRENNWPNGTMANAAKCADYCQGFAKAHAAQHGISVDQSYSDLLRTDPAFKIVWKAALQIAPPGE